MMVSFSGNGAFAGFDSGRMFNSNNNYLPDLNHYRSSGPAAAVAPQPTPMPDPTPPLPGPAGQYARVTGPFRFLSPTSGTAVPTWTPAMATVGMTMAMAPGVGTSWQHSVPAPMMWATQTAPQYTSHGIMTSAMPGHARLSFVPQTTAMRMAPRSSVLHSKRRFHVEPTSDTDGPCAKRYLSEKMAEHFRQLHISDRNGGRQFNVGMADDIGAATTRPNYPRSNFTFTTDNGWQRFKDVEKRLESEVDIIDSEDMAVPEATMPEFQGSEGMVLTLNEELKKEVSKPPNPVLPESILKSITNPCTELVLYRSPESVIPNGLLSPTTPLCDTATATDADNNLQNGDAAMVTAPSFQNADASMATASSFQNADAAMATIPSLPTPTLTFSVCSPIGKTASNAGMWNFVDSDDMDL